MEHFRRDAAWLALEPSQSDLPAVGSAARFFWLEEVPWQSRAPFISDFLLWLVTMRTRSVGSREPDVISHLKLGWVSGAETARFEADVSQFWIFSLDSITTGDTFIPFIKWRRIQFMCKVFHTNLKIYKTLKSWLHKYSPPHWCHRTMFSLQ